MLKYSYILFILLLLSSCSLSRIAASSSSRRAEKKVYSSQAPYWVRNAPKEEDSDYVFVSFGISKYASEPEAIQKAKDNVIADVFRALGVSVDFKSQSNLSGNLNSTNSNFSSSLSSSSSANIEYLVFQEYWGQEQLDGSLVLYVKALYNIRKFNEEKRRIEAINKQQSSSLKNKKIFA